MDRSEDLPPKVATEIESLRARVQELEQAEVARKKAASKLPASEERLRQIVDSVPIVLCSIEGGTNRILLMTGAVEEVLGYTPEELREDPDQGSRRIHPDDHVARTFTDGLASMKPFDLEFRHFHGKDDRVVWIRQHVVPIPAEDGSLLRYDNVILDVTKEKEAEEALRRSEERLRQIVDSVKIILSSVEGGTNRVLLITGAAEAILGYTIERLLAEPDLGSRNIHPEDASHVWNAFDQGLKSGEPFDIEFRFIHGRDKRVVWLFQHVVPVLAEDGSLLRHDNVILDITKQKEAEEALRHSEEHLRAVVTGAPIILFALDRDGIVTLLEGAGHERIGLTSEETVGQSVFDVFKDVPQVQEEARRALAGEFATGSIEINQRVFETRLSPVKNDAGEVIRVIGTATDVTERNRLQQQLLHSQKLESIGTLASGIAHDFNNLLAIIVGNVSLLKRHVRVTKKWQDLLKEIMNAAERASGLTRQLLDFAQSGFRETTSTNLNLILKSLQPLIEGSTPRDLKIVPKLTSSPPPIMVDASQIEQVIVNLCLNAIEASRPPGTIEIATGHQTLDAPQAADLGLQEGSYACLAVTDHGCGLDAETMERAFEPFFTTKPMGRGMGLAAAQGIVHSHNGQIRIESAPGRGTTARVWLPVAKTGETAPESERMLKPGTPPHGFETILIIDDDQDVSVAVEHILLSLGYVAVSHTNPRKALAFLDTNAEDIDLVIMDLKMPDTVPEEMLAQIQKRAPDAPVLLATGSETPAAIDELLKRGASNFVTKPFTLATLAMAVRKTLDATQTAAE